MRSYSILVSFIFSISFFLPSVLHTQVTNDNEFNIQVRSTGYYFNKDNVDGTNYPTFLLDGAPDNNSGVNCLINSDGTGYKTSAYWDADTGPNGTSRYTHSSRYRNLVTENRVSSTYANITYFAMEWVCGERLVYNHGIDLACTFSGNDKDAYRWCMNRNVKLDGLNWPGQWYQNWTYANDSDYGIRLERTWRYYNGESRTRPLTFGTLDESDFKTHTNWNNRAASGAASSMGYLNNWTSGMNPAFHQSADVTYSFSVDVTSRLIISTNYATTDFDTRIHLVKKISSSQWELIESNSDVNASNTKSIIDASVDPGDYYIVVEGDNYVTGKFLLSIDNTPVQFTGGSIDHPMPWVQDGCRLTESISSTEDATNSFGEPIQYDWYIERIDPDPTDNIFYVNDIIQNAGPTLEPEELGIIDVDSIVITRIAKTEHMERVSNPVIIESLKPGSSTLGIPADIGHNGRVEGRVVGEGTNIGIAGVQIQLLPHTNIHGACPDPPTTVTDEQGYFTLSRVYYGLLAEGINGQFKVVATLENHGFDKDTTIISGINTDSPNNNNLESSPIQDTTTFFISGLVFQEDDRSENQTNCGVPDVRFYVDDGASNILKIPTSDQDGKYALDIATIGNYGVEASLSGHDFLPSQYADIYVDQDIADINFKDITSNNLSGSVRACGDFIFGSVELLIEDHEGCFVFRDTTDASGNFSIDLPARDYTVSITTYEDPDLEDGYLIENIKPYFDRSVIEAPLDTGDVEINLIYRQPLIVEIAGIEANACGDIVLDQSQTYPIDIYITEENTGGCLLDTGSLIIVDAISGLEQFTVPISQGRVKHTIVPGDPNFGGDNKKLLTITARHIDSTYLPTTEMTSAIVTGYKAREATFTTVSPQVPFFILRDPPGDQSYSYLEEGTTTDISFGMSMLKGGAVNVWNKARIGSSYSVSLPLSPISTNVDIWGDIGSSTTVGFSNTTTTEGKLSFEHNSRYETSRQDDPEIVGQGGDLYVGAAMSLRYSKADILDYDSDNCEVLQSVDLVMGDADMQTKFVYSEYSIRESIIPSLVSLRDLSADPEDKAYYQDQIDVWNQTLDINQSLKDEANVSVQFPRRNSEEILGHQSSISWSGGGSLQDHSMTSSSTQSVSIEFNLEIDRELSAELGYNVAGSGASGGVNIRSRLELGVNAAIGTQRTTTTGFALQDDDILDRFETTVYECPVYKTPIFKNEASVTSCPYEVGSSPIDGPQLTALNPIVTNVAPDGNAGFNFSISNLSQDEKTRSYIFDVVQSSNPHNAHLNAAFPILLEDMAYGETRNRFISVSRAGADPSIFTYEGLEFIVYPAECDANGEFASSRARVSAYFDAECSAVTMALPEENWYVNQETPNNARRVWLKEYTEADLNHIIVQYTPAGFDSWQTAIGPLDADDLNDVSVNGTYVDWELSNVPDGVYELRSQLSCSNGSIYTERKRGTIDRVAPQVHGIPMPIDDIYDPTSNDQIGLTLTENIDCGQVVVQLQDLETGDFLEATVSCSGTELIVVPSALLELRAPSAYRVIVSGVRDLVGNVMDEYRWVFIVGDYTYDPGCSPVMISNNNLNQDAISQSVYRSVQISSDGLISSNTGIGFKAEENITLEPGFEVQMGGSLEASIEECQE